MCVKKGIMIITKKSQQNVAGRLGGGGGDVENPPLYTFVPFSMILLLFGKSGETSTFHSPTFEPTFIFVLFCFVLFCFEGVGGNL